MRREERDLSQIITVTGMILSAAPVGEYDRRIVILTKERGKISAFAKGARKPNSPLVGITNPFSFGNFQLYEGRTSYNLMQAEITNYFMELRENVEAAYYGFYFMEFADYYTKEYNDETAMLKLLYQTMRALVKGSIPYRLIRHVFELKAICINGEAPQVFQCVVCGCRDREVVFSAAKGGIVCEECMQDVADGMPLDGSTLYTMQFVEATPVEKLYTFTVTDEVLGRFSRIMNRYREVYIDRRFKSLEILEQLL